MPLYEYRCPECDVEFEQIRPLSQANEAAPCPRCHQPAKRKISTFASYTTGESGLSVPVAGTGSPCSGCSSSSCNTCGL